MDLELGKSAEDFGQALGEGLVMGAHRLVNFKRSPKKSSLKKVTIQSSKEVSRGAKTGVIVGEGNTFARRLQDTPANKMRPKDMVAEARKIAKSSPKITVKALDEKSMEKLGMGSLLSVSRGSSEPAYLIHLVYKPAKKAKRKICLVGKGLTFDSGGISIKPSARMDEMKYDMCGSTVVLGVFKALAALKPELNVVGIIPSTENLSGAKAYKPGDILHAYNGKTIEVLNTDAEGRLILADGLSYASKHYDPEYILDFATLTGAIVVTLGHIATGVMGNDDKLMEEVKLSSKKTGEKVWELPLWPEYCKQIKSDVADIKNMGSAGQAGSIAAGAFLKEFVGENIPWVHFDIAGTAWGAKPSSINPKGSATGVAIRLVLDMLRR